MLLVIALPLAFLLGPLPSGASENERSLTVGVLQEFYLTPWDRQTIVRPAFRKSGGVWRTYPDGFRSHHPRVLDRAEYESALGQMLAEVPKAAAKWTVCFEGKALGEVHTMMGVNWKKWPLRGSVGVTTAGTVPWQGQESWEFAGVDGEHPVHRPLVVTDSRACAAGPQAWSARALPPKILEGIGRRFDVAAGKSVPCESEEEGPDQCPVNVSEWSVRRSLGSADGDWLLEAEAVNKGPNKKFLFLIHQGEVRLLGTEMRVLDTGDYDGDGRTEVLAIFQRYNHEGHVLFFGPNLEKSLSYGWRIQ